MQDQTALVTITTNHLLAAGIIGVVICIVIWPAITVIILLLTVGVALLFVYPTLGMLICIYTLCGSLIWLEWKDGNTP